MSPPAASPKTPALPRRSFGLISVRARSIPFEELDLWRGAAELARLIGGAREGTATKHDLSGSTITITSLGALGGIVTTPIINHPEVAIVGVNRIVERPVIRDGQVARRQMMNLSSSFDHRVIDG